MKNSNMVRENGDSIPDGADEKMLGSDDKETLALKNIEVKFITGDQNQNGDAKIDIGGEKVSWQMFPRLISTQTTLQRGVKFLDVYKLSRNRWTHIQF